MKQIIINNVSYYDFKGVSNFNTSFQIGRNRISGENASGKTTLAEAIIFAFTGRGLFNETIKNEPIKNGKIRENYRQVIRLEFLVNNKPNTLTKVIEKNSVKEMIINGKQYKLLKEFNTELEDILGIKIEELALLMNPKYFNSIPNKEARKWIIELADNKESESNLVSNKNILLNIESGIDLATQFSYKEDEVKSKQKELDSLEIKIKAKKESRQNISVVDFESQEDLLTKKKLLENELKQLDIKRDEEFKKDRRKNQLNNELQSLYRDSNIDLGFGTQIKTQEEKLKLLRKEYDEVNLKPINDKCAICGSTTAHTKELGEKHKEKELMQIEQQANYVRIQIQNLIRREEKEKEADKERVARINILKAEIDAISFEKFDIDSYNIKQKEIYNIVETIGSYQAIKIMDDEINNLENTRNRIKHEYDIENNELLMLKDTLKLKTELIEKSINDELENIKVKLFEIKKNGNVKNIFTITNLDGIDYARLNNAAQINAGIELINYIQRQKGIQLPIIVDNAECVNKLFATRSQTFELYVSNGEMEIK